MAIELGPINEEKSLYRALAVSCSFCLTSSRGQNVLEWLTAALSASESSELATGDGPEIHGHKDTGSERKLMRIPVE